MNSTIQEILSEGTRWRGGGQETLKKLSNTTTVKHRLTGTRLIRIPHYNGQFALSLGKESPYIFSKINPLKTDTPLIQTLSMPPSSEFLLTVFGCTTTVRSPKRALRLVSFPFNLRSRNLRLKFNRLSPHVSGYFFLRSSRTSVFVPSYKNDEPPISKISTGDRFRKGRKAKME